MKGKPQKYIHTRTHTNIHKPFSSFDSLNFSCELQISRKWQINRNEIKNKYLMDGNNNSRAKMYKMRSIGCCVQKFFIFQFRIVQRIITTKSRRNSKQAHFYYASDTNRIPTDCQYSFLFVLSPHNAKLYIYSDEQISLLPQARIQARFEGKVIKLFRTKSPTVEPNILLSMRLTTGVCSCRLPHGYLKNRVKCTRCSYFPR